MTRERPRVGCCTVHTHVTSPVAWGSHTLAVGFHGESSQEKESEWVFQESHAAAAWPFRTLPGKSHSIASRLFLCWRQSQVCPDSRGGDVNLPFEGNWQDHFAKEQEILLVHLWKTQPDEKAILSRFPASSCLCREEPVSPTFPTLGIWVCKDLMHFSPQLNTACLRAQPFQSCPILQPCGLQTAKNLCPGDSPSKNTGVGCHTLFQGIFPTEGSNPGLLCLMDHRWILYRWATGEAPTQYSIQFSLVAQSCPTFCDPLNRSTPGLPVHHQLLEFTQTHVHRVGDAIQPSHPLLSPSPPPPIPPRIRVFSNESTLCMRWPKYWSFSTT